MRKMLSLRTMMSLVTAEARMLTWHGNPQTHVTSMCDATTHSHLPWLKAARARSARSIDAKSAWKIRYLEENNRLPHGSRNNSRSMQQLHVGSTSLRCAYRLCGWCSRSATLHIKGVSVERIEDILDEMMDGATYSMCVDNHLARCRVSDF